MSQLYSFYSPINKGFAYTGELDEYAVLPYTDVIYNNDLIRPAFDKVTSTWIETITQEAIDSNKPPEITILETLCILNGIPVQKATEIQYDNLSFLKPKEAVYGLKGEKIYKDYVFVEEDLSETLVVRQLYNTVIEEKTHEGITVDVITGLKKTIQFFKREESPEEKFMYTLDFNVFPISTKNPVTGEDIVLYSSSKLEEFLENRRYKADNMLKSFNPNLYNWLYSAYGDLYLGYLKTGNSLNLISAFDNETDPTNLSILNKIVEEQFLVILFGVMDVYPEISVKDLIVMNLQ